MIATPWLIDRWGFRTMGIVIGIFALACLWIVGGGVSSGRTPPAGSPADDEEGDKTALPRGFLHEVAGVLHHRGFQIYLATLALLWLGTSMVNTTVVYVVTVLMGLPREQIGIVLGAAFAVTVAALWPLARIIRTLGTARALTWTLAAVTVIVPLIGTIGMRGAPFNAEAQGYVLIVLAAGPLAGLLVLPNVLLADIAEADHVSSGQGREAMFYAVQGLVLNIATALASALLGVVLSLGYGAGHTLGLRLIPMLAGACTFFALLIFRRYPRMVAAPTIVQAHSKA
jgi:GPH family glycoside/pentoside/hexuronide:cation symporter